MFEVNNTSIEGNIKDLNNLMDKYDEIMLNLYKQLDEASSVNWQDSNSMSFADCVEDEKKETSLLVDYIKSRKDIYSFIVEKYIKFGKKIAYDLKNKAAIINELDRCHGKASNILNQFYYINTSFFYEERWSIIQQREKIANIKNKLSKLKENVNKIFTEIEKIEKEVTKKIKDLSIIKINDFDFYLSPSTVIKSTIYAKDSGTLIEEDFVKNIAQISEYSKRESSCLNKIYEKFCGTLSYYKTSNTSDLSIDFEQMKVNNKEISSKRDKCIESLNNVIVLYKETVDKSIATFNSVGDKDE